MNKSRWIKALAEGETVVLEDAEGAWRVIWGGTPCTPAFTSEGAAQACLNMYGRGARAPEVMNVLEVLTWADENEFDGGVR